MMPKRIYFVTPQLFATKAISGEMISSPDTAASNHYHEDADIFSM